MKNLKRVLPVLGIVLWALLLLPFLLGAPAAHPATDDFTFAAYTHPTWVQTGSILHVLKDALSYALRTWRDWQGTVTGVIIMTLNPAVFSIDGYGWHAVMLLALCLLATGVFLRHFLEKRLGISKRMTLAAFLCLSAVQSEQVEEAMSVEDYALITRQDGYELRFRTVELWGELLEKLEENGWIAAGGE